MSADEIRRLAESNVLVNFCGKKHLDGEPCTECFDHSEHNCQDKEAIKSALLDYAAMVEKCEESLKCNFVAQDGRTTINSAVKAQVNYILRGDAGKEER